jgi:2-keto-4-pentenoate hydratase/2-oxohepta-3-ene-1,7-dioic acid hydratase in catechol pathway
LDYEVELAVIIGKEGRNIAREEVEDYIFGYSIFNDISSRRLQREHLQWFKGKSLDTYSVLGPVIVHKSAFAYPPEVEIECRVNGEVRQHSNTNLLIHNIATIISDFSQGITLEPGDIIATGTPSGVGMGFKPPRFMKKGDLVECEIAGIGILRNRIG